MVVQIAAVLVVFVVLLVLLHSARGRSWLPVASISTNTTDSSPASLMVSLRQLFGDPDPRDFYVDYASAHALTHGKNAYEISSKLFVGLGPAWPVNQPNPHPPTLLVLILPFTIVSYGTALSAWALSMVFALIATLRLIGLRLSYAIGIGVAVAIAYPGAYGIGNPVPIIGLGAAIAYRYRESDLVAGFGLALAAMPKGSGVILALPFLLAARFRTILYAIGFYALAALIPLIWQSDVWWRYLHSGVKSIDANASRGDNASILRGASELFGLPHTVTIVLILLITIVMAVVQRDLFWPTVWAAVALLPIAWMYSLLTLLPLLAFLVVISPKRTAWVVALAAGIAVSSPPFGDWPTYTFPIVLGLSAVAFLLRRPRGPVLWLSGPFERLVPRRVRTMAPSVD